MGALWSLQAVKIEMTIFLAGSLARDLGGAKHFGSAKEGTGHHPAAERRSCQMKIKSAIKQLVAVSFSRA